MGFGILLIGYFFLINITYFTLTDLLSAVLMLLALSSLSRFNKPLKWAFITDGIFTIVALSEFAFEVLSMFSLANTATLLSICMPVRYITLGVFNVFLLLGILIMLQVSIFFLCIDIGLTDNVRRIHLMFNL